MRSSVSMVMRLPSRNRCTSLPSLTAWRPNVVSAMSDCRQNSAIWLRISGFFIGGLGRTGGQRKAQDVVAHLPTLRRATLALSSMLGPATKEAGLLRRKLLLVMTAEA